MEVTKVAVHGMGWVTKDGWICQRWGQYHVFAGSNPVGPRGGRCGNIESGYDAAGYRFRKRLEAEKFGKQYAETNGFEYIG